MNTVQSGLKALRDSAAPGARPGDGGHVIAAMPDRDRAADLPEGAHARPHLRGGEGMRTAPRPAGRWRSRLAAGAGRGLRFRASRSSSPATTRRRRRRFGSARHHCAGARRAGRRRFAPPPSTDAGEQPVDHATGHERDHDDDSARRLPDCPVDALDSVPPNRSRSRSGTASASTTTRRSSASPMTTTPARTGSMSRPRTRAATSRRSTSSSSRPWTTGPTIVMFPDYATQQAIDSQHGDPGRRRAPRRRASTCRSSSPRRSRPTAPPACNGRCRSTCRTRSSTTTATCSRRPDSTPNHPPQSLEELRQYSQQLVDSGAATYGIALDSGSGSGGGWYLEQWFANMGELYADNGNGRLAPATQVLVRRRRRRRLLTSCSR